MKSGANKKITKKQRWLHRFTRVFFALLVASLVYQAPLEYLEALTYDLRLTFAPKSKPQAPVALIAIDNNTQKRLESLPYASEHIRFLKNLLAKKPLQIVYLINPAAIKGTPKEKQELAQLMLHNEVYAAVDNLPSPGQLNSFSLDEPFAKVPLLPGPITADGKLYAKDGITRRFIVGGINEDYQTLEVLLTEKYLGKSVRPLKGQFELYSTQQAYINFHKPGTFPTSSFIEVLDGQGQNNKLTNKIVFVGSDTGESADDYIHSPYSKEQQDMTVLETHAHILDTVWRDSGLKKVGGWIDFASTFFFSLLTIYVVLRVRPIAGLGVLAIATLGFTGLSYLLFALFGLWLTMAHTLIATLACYYFFIPYRLVMENRRSWEYYQKNKLLTQVEELKSNFLRLMSHDLRTPLARIQGMANVVLGEKNNLSQTQERAMESIFISSEELSDFIGSILSLGRIESKEIKLHLKSKDINSLLTDVIRKSEFLAKKRGIEIRSEFEPMFSFKVDEDLIRQVLTNLVENAIKYSPDNSKILISTEEIEGRAVIQIADQGIGIAREDQPFIFDKFYRSQSVKKTEVSGSGLGLYLVKYFVELHRGQVEVESEPGKGSTFTISLPMVMDAQNREEKEGAFYV